MSIIIDTAKKNLLGIFLAVILATISCLPTYLSILDLNKDYKGIPYIYQDAEDVYLARIREVTEGHTQISQAYTFENKELSSVQNPYGEMIYAYSFMALKNVVNIDLTTFFHFSKFLLVLIFSLTIFIFCSNIYQGRYKTFFAALSTSFIVLGFELSSPGYLRHIFNLHPNYHFPTIWTRAVNPITGGILLFLSLSLIFKIFQNKNDMQKILSIENLFLILLAAMSSGYIFSYLFINAILGIVLLYSVYEKAYVKTKIFLFLIFGNIALNYNYFYSIAYSILHKSGESYALKSGLLISHYPIWNTFLFLSLFILSIFLFICIKKPNFFDKSISKGLLFLSLLHVAGILCLNFQAVTGFTIWPDHFVQYTIPIVFLSQIFIFFILSEKFAKKQFLAYIIIYPTFIFIFYLGIRDAFAYKYNLAAFKDLQKYSELINYFKDKNECVVLFSDGYPTGGIDRGNRILPSITSCDVYMTHYVYANVPERDIFHRYYAHLKVNNIKPNELDQHHKDNPLELNSLFFKDWGEMFRYNQNKWLAKSSDNQKNDAHIAEVKNKILNEYAEIYKMNSQDFKKYLGQFKITDIVVERNKSRFNLDKEKNFYKEFEKVLDSEYFIVYKSLRK